MARFIVLFFSVAVATYLIYRMLEILKKDMPPYKKAIVLTGGLLLLLAPFGVFFRMFVPSTSYFLFYPVAISLFLYLIKEI